MTPPEHASQSEDQKNHEACEGTERDRGAGQHPADPGRKCERRGAVPGG
jgi:hypothetical protein